MICNVEELIEKKARKISDREFYLSVENNWAIEGFPRCDLFSEVTKKIKRKAIATIFNKDF